MGFQRVFSKFSSMLKFIKFKYRDRVTIVADILDTIYRDPKGKTKTGIMRAANLNFSQANEYLDHLMLCDIVKATDPIGNQEAARYRLTQKGSSFLKNYDVWYLVLDSFRKRIV